MITEVKLVPRIETHEEWEMHKQINQEIAEKFKESMQNFDSQPSENIPIISKERILYKENCAHIPYGSKSLAESGCAVFCLEQGLRIKGIKVNICDLAEEVNGKGYYCEGVGTYHNLFDKHKNGFATRCSSYEEVFTALNEKRLVTLLVDNQLYYGDKTKKGSHFINLIGKNGAYLLVQNPDIQGVLVESANRILKASKIAWAWN